MIHPSDGQTDGRPIAQSWSWVHF